MVDLTKIPFGTKLVNKITGEVGVYNSMFTEPSHIIRVGDKQYQGTTNSPLIQEWEVFEENWNLADKCINTGDDNSNHFWHISYDDIKILKQKILEDINKLSYRSYPSDEEDKYGCEKGDVIKILDERFGF